MASGRDGALAAASLVDAAPLPFVDAELPSSSSSSNSVFNDCVATAPASIMIYHSP